MLKKLLDTLYLSSGVLAALCIVAIVVIVTLQVFFALIDKLFLLILDDTILGLTIPSYSDFTGFLFVAASFLSLPYALKHNSHIKVNVVINLLPNKLKKILEIIALIIAFIITCYAVFYMIDLIKESIEYKDMSSGMVSVYLWIPQTPLLIGLIILGISLIDNLLMALTDFNIIN